MEGFFILIPIVLLVGLILRVAAGGMDQGRVEEYVRNRGGEVLECHWAPLGPGWFGEKSDRIYHVRYRDAQGNVHDAHCKTSMMTGVYFTEDQIVSTSESPDLTPGTVTSLEEENRRLREELEELRRQQRGT